MYDAYRCRGKPKQDAIVLENHNRIRLIDLHHSSVLSANNSGNSTTSSIFFR